MSQRRETALELIRSGADPEAAMLEAGYGERLAKNAAPAWWEYFGVDPVADAASHADEPEEEAAEETSASRPADPEPPDSDEEAALPIEDLDFLTSRQASQLRKAKIATSAQLKQAIIDGRDLTRVPHIGEATVRAAVEWLDKE